MSEVQFPRVFFECKNCNAICRLHAPVVVARTNLVDCSTVVGNRSLEIEVLDSMIRDSFAEDNVVVDG